MSANFETASCFSAKTPKFQTAWDSTSLACFKACARRYYYMHVLGYQSRGSSPHLYFGIAFHEGREKYRHALAQGSTHDEAVLVMVKYTLDKTGTRDASGRWTSWLNDDIKSANIKNRYTLVRSLVWWADWQKDLPLTTLILANGKPAVELSFRFHAFDLDDEPILLCGHMDEVADDDSGQRYVADAKTSQNALKDSYFQQFSPNTQISLYSVAAKVVLDEEGVRGEPRRIAGVLIDAAQIGVNFTRFARRPIPRPAAVLEEFLDETKGWIALAHDYARRDYWPKNESSCFLCSFKRVCSQAPSFRETWLKTDYVSWAWNPLEARGGD